MHQARIVNVNMGKDCEMSCKNCRACQIREKALKLAEQRKAAKKEEAAKARKAMEEQFVKGHAVVALVAGELLKDEPLPVETP